MNQLTNLNCDTIIFVWYLWFCQEHLAKLTDIMMDMLRGQRCWLMASEVTELVSTGETWINFSASCSGFIFTTSLPPTVLAGSLASVRLLRRKTTESQAPGQCQVSSPSGSTLQTCTSPQTVVATSSQQQPDTQHSLQLNNLGEVQSLSQVNYFLKYFGKWLVDSK